MQNAPIASRTSKASRSEASGMWIVIWQGFGTRWAHLQATQGFAHRLDVQALVLLASAPRNKPERRLASAPCPVSLIASSAALELVAGAMPLLAVCTAPQVANGCLATCACLPNVMPDWRLQRATTRDKNEARSIRRQPPQIKIFQAQGCPRFVLGQASEEDNIASLGNFRACHLAGDKGPTWSHTQKPPKGAMFLPPSLTKNKVRYPTE